MRASGRHTFWRNLRKRLTASVALLAYLTASFGLPLPATAAPRDRSVPYPCMDNPCGCTCAEDCWRHCCCTTPEERWAWAAAHNVTPPDYAERPAADKAGAPSRSEDACPRCHSREAGKRTAAEARGVCGLSALRCKGLSTLSVGAGTTAVLFPVAWRPAAVLAGRLTDTGRSSSRLPRTPPSPPPR